MLRSSYKKSLLILKTIIGCIESAKYSLILFSLS
uniref:Uncharacterized protein n=1 Tax=Podoviridae sp. ctG4L18 TaxID=2825234 RepID=A0A8S5UNP1_9CAUD|nr:MAG TPA: hypothetical protein [Podoviridae sp. ctG4L18]